MAKGKDFPLSITLRAVDKATPELKRFNDRLEKSLAPFKSLGKEFGRLRDNLGLPQIASGLKGIGAEIKSIAKGLGVIGTAGAAAVYGFKKLSDEFDNLGDKAEAIGIGVDALAQLRYAAGQSGGEMDSLDSSLASFNTKLGQAKAGTGRFASFLKKVSPEFLKQIKGAKGSEEALDLLADAMAKLEDPTKKAALAAAAGFDEGLIPLLSRGSAGIRELRGEFFKAAGSQEAAAEAAGGVDKQWRLMGASLQGVKAGIVSGVGPAFADLVRQAGAFLGEHREQIAAWARDFGEKLPGRIRQLIEVLRGVRDALAPVVSAIARMVEMVGGAENAVKLLIGAFIAFKALKIGGHLFEIAGGLAKIAMAARGAGGALAGMGGGGAGAAAAAAGGRGIVGRVAGKLPLLASVYAGAEGVASLVDRDQTVGMDAALRGQGLRADLDRFRKSGSERHRQILAQGLRTSGFVDPKTGRFRDTLANRAALNGGSLGSGGLDTALALQGQEGTISELNTALAGGASRQVFGAFRDLLQPVLGAANVGGKQRSEAHVKIDLRGAPPGTRVTVDPASTADTLVNTGYQMGAAP